MRVSIFFLSLVFIFSLIPSGKTFAIEPVSVSEILYVTINPESPEENELVNLKVESNSINLQTVNISWSVNGAVQSEGTGKTTFSFITGGFGELSRVLVTVTPPSGKTFSKDIFIQPAGVDLVWEAQTYASPFYKGASVFTGEAPVTIMAIPYLNDNQGGALDRESLIYNWSLNDKPKPNDSGYGKSSFKFDGSFWGRDDKVRVEVTSVANSFVRAEKEITLKPSNPKLLVYEDNPLVGVLFNRSVTGTYTMQQNSEVSFFVSPFSFINNLLTADTEYSWRMNGRDIETPEGGNVITLRGEVGQKGTSNVSVSAKQSGKTFQTASTNFSVQVR